MSEIETNPATPRRFHLHVLECLRQDLEQFRLMTEQFRAGVIPAEQYQAYRVPNGIYEQRESGTFMVRLRLPAGILLPDQMSAAADVAEAFGSGVLHLTSRQDLQIHGIQLDGLHPVLVRLAQAGLSAKGGGGNTVRNVAACFQAGVCQLEPFDVTPHVLALTERLLQDPESMKLPRKYKIAFSGCPRDCAGATVNDLGFIAHRRAGQDGFSVYVGGGMGAQSRPARLLEEFIPAALAPQIALAIRNLFDQHGNRKNRSRARLRFLIEDLGFDAFKDLHRQELAQLKDASSAKPQPLPPPIATQKHVIVPEFAPHKGFDDFRGQHVLPQSQNGFCAVEIATPLGIIDGPQMRDLARIIARYGEGLVRATPWQNLVLRWVRQEDLESLHAELARIELGTAQPPIIRHLVSCAGASTCRLGIGKSRGLARAVVHALRSSSLNLRGAAGNVLIHISGCPNACGRHPIAQIGLYGAVRRVNDRLVPYYNIQLGGHVEEGNTILASGSIAVPARVVPAYLVDFLYALENAPSSPDFDKFLADHGRVLAQDLATRHNQVPPYDQDPTYYKDWDDRREFSLAGRGPGECAVGN